MQIDVSDYEKLGKFYLGRDYDLAEGKLQEELHLYDSKDLVTHGVVLGMTGSGKTGLCMALLEEAAMDGIPAIIIDPKGDIANLMLTFPEFQPEDFRPWVNEDDARKKGITPEQFSEKTAKMWEEGIGSWGQSPERVRQLKSKVEVNIFTPGSKAGIPVSIMSSLEVPPFEVMDDGELLADLIESTVSSLLSLVGVDADPIQSPEAVLLSSIFQHCWAREESLTLESLIRHIQAPDFGKVGVIDLESFFSSKNRQKLALKFNNLIASPGFSTWLEGPALNVKRMLSTEEGKPRISIFSIAHLSDSERMFFVSLLLNQMLGWMRTQNGTTSLRALLYMDEIYGYLPPTANPPSKKPLMTMFKQARAFGLGVLVATQNPVDLDYKALSNIGTWWLGRLQTERDKARVLDGLEGVAAGQSEGFKRKKMEELLAGLGSRVFLQNNVHEDAPVVFHVRWVMSYLCGPLTKRQIKNLMDPFRGRFEKSQKRVASSNPMAMSRASAKVTRPLVGQGVQEFFVPVSGEGGSQTYSPYLLRQATVHFSHTKSSVECSRIVRKVNPMNLEEIDWEQEVECLVGVKGLEKEPRDGVAFADLPGYAMNASNYKPVGKEFVDWVYRNERVSLFYSPLYKEYSIDSESEGDFRTRLSHQAREMRDEAVDALRDKYERKIKSKTSMLSKAELRLDKEKAEATSATMQASATVFGKLLGGLLGGRRSRASTVTAASRVYKQRQDIGIAKERIEDLEKEIEELEGELRVEVGELEQKYHPENTELETVLVKPFKKDIDLDEVAVLWIAE